MFNKNQNNCITDASRKGRSAEGGGRGMCVLIWRFACDPHINLYLRSGRGFLFSTKRGQAAETSLRFQEKKIIEM